jgi:archaellum component FlaC
MEKRRKIKMNNQPKFELGQVVMTIAINKSIATNEEFLKDIYNSLSRYRNCDFSDMKYPEDIESNMSAIENNDDRIFATYNTCKGKIYIITECDRSYTTILFPDEY